MNIGKAGLSEREAIKEGFKIASTIVPASDVAHYYPGAKDIIIKLIADVPTRKLLGAECGNGCGRQTYRYYCSGADIRRNG